MESENRETEVERAVGVMSLTTDLAMGQPLEHGLRTAMIAVRLARAMGLPEDQQATTFYTGVLHFAGCPAARAAAEKARKEAAAKAAASREAADRASRDSSRTSLTTPTYTQKSTVNGTSGTKSSYNWATAGQCTWGALNKWYQSEGYYPGGWTGNAMVWDTGAANAGYTVSGTPRRLRNGS